MFLKLNDLKTSMTISPAAVSTALEGYVEKFVLKY